MWQPALGLCLFTANRLGRAANSALEIRERDAAGEEPGAEGGGLVVDRGHRARSVAPGVGGWQRAIHRAAALPLHEM